MVTPRIKGEVDYLAPIGLPLPQMMNIAQLVENRELTQLEAGLHNPFDSKAHTSAHPTLKMSIPITTKDGGKQPLKSVQMRTITLCGVSTASSRRESLAKRLSNAEFQAHLEKGLCFRCIIRDQCELRILIVRDNFKDLKVF